MTILGLFSLIRLIARPVVLANQWNVDVDGLEETERPSSVLANQRTIGVLEGRKRPKSATTVAIVPKEQKEYDGLGPIGIIREAHKIWSTHFIFFCLIQVSLILPFAIVEATAHSWLLGDRSEERPARSAPGGPGRSILTGHGGVLGFIEKAFEYDLAVQQIVLVGVVVVLSIAVTAAWSLYSSAIIYAVGLHYIGQSVSFVDVLRVSVPRLWMRLTITNIYHTALSIATASVGFGVVPLLHQKNAPRQLVFLVISVFILVELFGAFCLEVIFMPARSVSVLEQDYGWAAVRRALKLLKGRLMAALLFQLLWSLTAIVLTALKYYYRGSGVGSDANSGATHLVFTALYVGCMTYVFLLKELCTGIQYATFKAYHGEVVGESMSKFGAIAVKGGGYEPLQCTIDDDNKGGKQEADTLV